MSLRGRTGEAMEQENIMDKRKQQDGAAVEARDLARDEELRAMLRDRQRALMSEVRGKIREVRTEGSEQPYGVLDPGETIDVATHVDVEFALIQIKAETLNRINEALSRLDLGTYGHCFECGEEISHTRLRALPFAVRCKACEEARELARRREQLLARGGRTAVGLDPRQTL